MSATLFLDPILWDLSLNSDGNIALGTDPYSLAQDAASAIRTFQGEVWYSTDLGIPYWGQILGELPPLELMKAYFVAAALTVPGVVAARAFITNVQGREVTGSVLITDNQGVTSVAAF